MQVPIWTPGITKELAVEMWLACMPYTGHGGQTKDVTGERTLTNDTGHGLCQWATCSMQQPKHMKHLPPASEPRTDLIRTAAHILVVHVI